jgi:parallel beta-helix repeat protein
MKNKLFLMIFVITIFLSLCLQVKAATITVPDDYSTIQEAIVASAPGDTVSVNSGTYQESIVIDKQISLIGEGRATTTIMGTGMRDVIHITSNGVKVGGFTIKGSGSDYIGPFTGGDAGIILNNVEKCIISDNTVTEDNIGIFLNESNKNTIENNMVHDNGKDGIYGRYSNDNIIRDNNVSANGGHGGIYLNPGNNRNLIENNFCLRNVPEHGIKIQTESNYNIIRGNKCLYNGDGIFLGDAHYNEISNNICSNSTLRTGMTIRLSENNIISGNTVEHNPDHGIDLDFLNFNNTIKDNICSWNVNGITLRLSSHHNKVISNTCTHNERSGIEIEQSDYNEITHNTLAMNSNGINIRVLDANPDNEWNSVAQWEFAMNKFKDDVEERVANGVQIESEDSAGNEIHWNIIEGNKDFGYDGDISSDVDATKNWWGAASGPFHPQENPEGKGDEVQARGSGNIIFESWLKSPTIEETQTEEEVADEPVDEVKEEIRGNNMYWIIVIIVVILIVIFLVYKKFKK